MRFRTRNFGFTLAEVLITLGIIGIVAAMTIPALMQSTQDQELKVAWKKTFSTFSQAQLRIMAENGGDMVGYSKTTSANDSRDAFLDYLSYSKKCDIGSIYGNCWHQSGVITYLNGLKDVAIEQDAIWNFAHTAGAVLNDGVYVLFSQADAECDYTALLRCSEITVDINGAKKPNVVGRDVFRLVVTNNSMRPYGYWHTSSELDNLCSKNPNSGTDSFTNYACSAYYLNQ